MTLVERKEQYETQRTQLVEQKTKLLKQLEETTIAIEQYNGAIAAQDQAIKDSEIPVEAKSDTDCVNAKPEMTLEK